MQGQDLHTGGMPNCNCMTIFFQSAKQAAPARMKRQMMAGRLS